MVSSALIHVGRRPAPVEGLWKAEFTPYPQPILPTGGVYHRNPAHRFDLKQVFGEKRAAHAHVTPAFSTDLSKPCGVKRDFAA